MTPQPNPQPGPDPELLAVRVTEILDRALTAVGDVAKDAFLVGYEAGYRDGAEILAKFVERAERNGGPTS